MLACLALTLVLFLGIGLQPSQSIHTGRERHALLGSDVRLPCSFLSWNWTSEDVTFSWNYRADDSQDSISVLNYTGGVAYLDNWGPFKDRLEFVGNPARHDGSILIKNLDFSDNGTFTCDAMNPPDVVGRFSRVRLLVLENMPIQTGVIRGAIVGAVLGLLVLIVLFYCLARFLLGRRVFSKHGKRKGIEESQPRQGPALSLDLSKLKAASTEERKQEPRKNETSEDEKEEAGREPASRAGQQHLPPTTTTATATVQAGGTEKGEAGAPPKRPERVLMTIELELGGASAEGRGEGS